MKAWMTISTQIAATVLLVSTLSTSTAGTPVLTLRADRRPEWLRREGIVMAGSWEPLLFRVRRDGAAGYTPTAEQRTAYEREHTPEMVAKLKITRCELRDDALLQGRRAGSRTRKHGRRGEVRQSLP